MPDIPVSTALLERISDRYISFSLGCWTWTGARSANGYGNHRSQPAHRVVYTNAVGPIPAGLVLDHLCRNSLCVRPDHLEPVPQKANVLRGNSFAAVNAAKTHCPAGHPYSPENTYMSNGRRCCSECNKRKCRERYYRRRGANA